MRKINIELTFHYNLVFFFCHIAVHALAASGPAGNLARGNNTPSTSRRMKVESEAGSARNEESQPKGPLKITEVTMTTLR